MADTYEGASSDPNQYATPITPGAPTYKDGRWETTQPGTGPWAMGQMATLFAKYIDGVYAKMAREDLDRAIQESMAILQRLQREAPTRGITLKCTYADVALGQSNQVYLLTMSYGYADGSLDNIWDNVENPMASRTSRSTEAAGGASSKKNYGTTRIRLETYMIPPMSGTAQKPEPGWMQYYRIVSSKLSTGDAAGAIRALNGCNMYDMLRILYRFAVEGRDFNTLFNALASVSGVGTLRLMAAFLAVTARMGGVNNWKGFALSFQDYSKLADFERRDIEVFLGRSFADEDAETEGNNVLGAWIVTCGPWTWLYSFKGNRTVTWRDQGNGKTGHGKWSIGAAMKTTWAPSKTYEIWNRPITESSMSGVAYMKEGTFSLAANRLNVQ